MWKTTGTLIASAAAALILAGAVSVPATEQTEKSGAGKVMCEGVNECKGKGSCATAQNDCAGTNACKGKGAVSLSREECEKKGGKVSEKTKM